MFSAVIQIAWRILYPKWECFRQSSAWICISVKHIDHCTAHSLSAQIGFQHGFYFFRATAFLPERRCEAQQWCSAVLPPPLQSVRSGSSASQDASGHTLRIQSCPAVRQRLPPRPHFAAASTAFAANASSVLSSTSSKPLANVMFSFYSCEKFYGVHCRFCFKAVDVGTSAALIAWFLGVFADKATFCLRTTGEAHPHFSEAQYTSSIFGLSHGLFMLKYCVFVSVFPHI